MIRVTESTLRRVAESSLARPNCLVTKCAIGVLRNYSSYAKRLEMIRIPGDEEIQRYHKEKGLPLNLRMCALFSGRMLRIGDFENQLSNLLKLSCSTAQYGRNFVAYRNAFVEMSQLATLMKFPQEYSLFTELRQNKNLAMISDAVLMSFAHRFQMCTLEYGDVRKFTERLLDDLEREREISLNPDLLERIVSALQASSTEVVPKK